jgi:hypothetical protein
LSEQLSTDYQEKCKKQSLLAQSGVFSSECNNSSEKIHSSAKSSVNNDNNSNSSAKAASNRLTRSVSKSTLLTAGNSKYIYYRRYDRYYSWITALPAFLRSYPILTLFSTLHRTFWYSYTSITSMSYSFYNLIFGSNELLSNTTVYESLNKDISLLEGPETEISLLRKLQVTKRMRRSYRMFAPIK